MNNGFTNSRNSQELLSFFTTIDGVIVNEVEESFYLHLFISLIFKNQVSVFFDFLLVSKFQKFNVSFELTLDSFDQRAIHKISIFKHLKCQFSCFFLKTILNLKFFTNLVHQVNKTNQILKPLKVFDVVAVDVDQRFFDFTFNQDKVSLQRNVDFSFSYCSSFVFICCFIKQSDVLDHVIFF